MATIVEAVAEDIAMVFLVALLIFFIIVATWSFLQAIENMPSEEEKVEAKRTVQYIGATGVLALLLLTAAPSATLLILLKFLGAK